MELHPGLQKAGRRILPRWLVNRIDPFQAEIEKLVALAARETQSHMKVLDAGAGEGRHSSFFSHAQYVALDRCVGDLRWNYRGVHVRGDISHMPVASGSVDRVLCVVTLEHVEDPVEAVSEFARILKRGGKIYLVTPLMWEEHQMPYDYFRFTSSALRRLLDGAGLETERLDPVGGFFWMYGRRSVNLVAFFQSSWKWVLFPFVAAVAGVALPLLCYYLDKLDREKRHTLGHIAVAVKAQERGSVSG